MAGFPTSEESGKRLPEEKKAHFVLSYFFFFTSGMLLKMCKNVETILRECSDGKNFEEHNSETLVALYWCVVGLVALDTCQDMFRGKEEHILETRRNV